MVGLALGLLMVCFSLATADLGPLEDREALTAKLTSKRSLHKLVPPSGEDRSVHVKHSFAGSGIVSLENNVLELVLWNEMTWVDSRLSWDPQSFGNITKVNLPSEMVWLPDIIVTESIEQPTPSHGINAVIKSDGSVIYIPPVNLKTRCSFDESALYRQNTVTCQLKFMSWTYDCRELDFQPMEIDVEPGMDFLPSADWKILSIKAVHNEMKYACCPENYCDITYTLTIERR